MLPSSGDIVTGLAVVMATGFDQPPQAEAFSRPSAQPIANHTTHKAGLFACAVNTLCPVYFSAPTTLHL